MLAFNPPHPILYQDQHYITYELSVNFTQQAYHLLHLHKKEAYLSMHMHAHQVLSHLSYRHIRVSHHRSEPVF